MNTADRVARYGNPTPGDAWISGGRWDHVELSPSLASKHAFPEMTRLLQKLARRDGLERKAKAQALAG
jgi:hypothetical protein